MLHKYLMSFKLLQLKKFSETFFLKEKFINEVKILEHHLSSPVQNVHVRYFHHLAFVVVVMCIHQLSAFQSISHQTLAQLKINLVYFI